MPSLVSMDPLGVGWTMKNTRHLWLTTTLALFRKTNVAALLLLRLCRTRRGDARELRKQLGVHWLCVHPQMCEKRVLITIRKRLVQELNAQVRTEAKQQLCKVAGERRIAWDDG